MMLARKAGECGKNGRRPWGALCGTGRPAPTLLATDVPTRLATEMRRVGEQDMGHIVRHPSCSVQNQGPTKDHMGFQIV